MAKDSIASCEYAIALSLAVATVPSNAATLVQRVTAAELEVSPIDFGTSIAVSGGNALLGASGDLPEF